LKAEWEENGCAPQVEKLVPVYHKTDVLGLQTLLRYRYGVWACNGSSVEVIWNNVKVTVSESIKRFVPYKIFRKNPDPECIQCNPGSIKNYAILISERYILHSVEIIRIKITKYKDVTLPFLLHMHMWCYSDSKPT